MRGDCGDSAYPFKAPLRSPVEIPTTWGEARVEFRTMCAVEGYSQVSCSAAEEKIFENNPRDFGTTLSMDRQVIDVRIP